MSIGSDAVSVHSIAIDSVSLRSLEMYDEAIRQSVLDVLKNEEQMAALSDEDKERVQHMASTFWTAESQQMHVDVIDPAEFAGRAESDYHSDASEDSDSQVPDAGEVTQDENLVRTLQMLFSEMGDAVLTSLPNFALFDLIRSIAKLVDRADDDEEWNTVIELLNCSSSPNLIQRLEAWPAVKQMLTELAVSSQFGELFGESMRELNERHERDERHPVTGKYRLGECDLCCSVTDTLLWDRGCCETSVCVVCLNRWLVTRLSEVHSDLACPGCSTVLTVSETRHLLNEEAVARREKLLSRLRADNGERDCPRCSCMARRPVVEKRKKFGGAKKVEKEQGGVVVKCVQCDYLWCFDCHSPAHPGLSCRRHRSGAQQLESWAKKMEETGLRKARRCPRCRVLIEKNDGCNHMTCVNCRHEFCYICKKNWHVKEINLPYFGWSVFGSHSSRLSVFGCSQSFMPNRPALRRFIRGTLFVVRACGLVLVPTVIVALLVPLALALVGIAIPLSPFIIPAVLLLYTRYRKRRSA